MHRFQISVFGSIAITFAVIGVNQGIFTGIASLGAMAAGWLILSVVDILWVLYFTSEEDSLTLHIFNSLGTGGLTPPSRRRRGNRAQSVHNMGVGNGYGAGGGGYSSPSAVGAAPYDAKGPNSFGPTAGVRSQGSLHTASLHDGVVPKSSTGVNGSLNGGTPAMPMANLPADSAGMGSPLMGPGAAGVGAGGGPLPEDTSATPSDSNYMYKAKALYACKWPMSSVPKRLCSDMYVMHQTRHLRTTQTKFPSQKERYSTSLTRTGNGGKQRKRMVP